MATNNNGTATSISNTPQATDDVFTAAMTGLTCSSLGTICLNVMANDLGGAAKTLYSIDSGSETTIAAEQSALLCQDTVRAETVNGDLSYHGAHIWITADGKIRNCLFDQGELDLRAPLRAGASEAELEAVWRRAVKNKGVGGCVELAEESDSESTRRMWQIGG